MKESTRIESEKQHVLSVSGGYPYRTKADFVLEELDLKPGDVVVDIGAGDGFWSEKMAQAVGKSGTVHAGEISEEKVEKLKKRLEKLPQAKPYVCPTDGTGLEENTCDLAFLSKTYHHLDKDGQIDYLRHLRKVIKPTGRLVVIERYKGNHQGPPGRPRLVAGSVDATSRRSRLDPRPLRTNDRHIPLHRDLRAEGVVSGEGVGSRWQRFVRLLPLKVARP